VRKRERTTVLCGDTVDELPAAEVALLIRGGLDPFARSQTGQQPTSGLAMLTVLVEEGVSTKAAARLLRIDHARVLHRLNADPPELLGIKHGRTWHLPRFQFEGRRLVPGFAKVLAAIDPELHPVTLFRWFNEPCVDLTDSRHAKPLTPRQWLLSGRLPRRVIALASGL
jgi:hypothetical protein